MLALAPEPSVTEGGFDFEQVPADHPVVVELLGRFLRRFNIPPDTLPRAAQFFLLSRHGVPALVLGLGVRADGGIELTDAYPMPTRDGIRAVYEVLALGKVLIDKGVIPYGVGSTLARNVTMQRRIERVLGVKPVALIYSYPKPEGQ